MSSSKSRMMISRFLALDDPNVKYVLVRDLDARFSVRELLAVNEWISSGLPFHVMRDHEYHDAAVLGGMFGMHRGALGRWTSMRKLVLRALKENTLAPYSHHGFGEDQLFLSRYVWQLVKANTIAHDSNLTRCLQYDTKICKNFPLGPRTDNFFVGDAFKTRENYKKHFSCTVSCFKEEIP